MTLAARRLVVGNWKMNGSLATLRGLPELHRAAALAGIDLIVAPPYTLVAAATAALPALRIAGQDCHAATEGPHTGAVSAGMLRAAGAGAVILGHSECRARGESDADVRAKVSAAAAHDLLAIVCVGEVHRQAEAGSSEREVCDQLVASLPEGVGGNDIVVAYEPVWAIGSGTTPSVAQIERMHRALRDALASRLGGSTPTVVVYGGSVGADNAAALAAADGVDGLLVGGASLRLAEFLQIIAAVGDADRRSVADPCDGVPNAGSERPGSAAIDGERRWDPTP